MVQNSIYSREVDGQKCEIMAVKSRSLNIGAHHLPFIRQGREQCTTHTHTKREREKVLMAPSPSCWSSWVRLTLPPPPSASLPGPSDLVVYREG